MSDAENAGLVVDEPAGDVTSLDSIIDKALEASESADAPETDEAKAERVRDERGRFAPKDTATEAPDKGTAKVAEPAAQAAPAPALEQPVEAPARWTADDKAKFASWPRDVQIAVSERNKAIEADYTRKTQEAAEIRRYAEPLLNAVAPFDQYLRELAPVIGQQPHEMVRGLLATEHALRTGSIQQKAQALHGIAQQYGIDLAALARGQVQGPDPATTQLRQELSELKQWRSQFEEQSQQQQDQQVALHIDAFAKAKDESGRPRYPHFARVKGIMGQMMASGEAPTLEDAYQKAIEPINAAIAEELRTRQTAADTQRKDALVKADKAAPVRSSGSQPGGSAKGRDLDSLLSDAMAKAGM